MRIVQSPLHGVWLVEPTVWTDERGYFMETYRRDLLAELGLTYDFVQDNHSFSKQSGTLRGLHYQTEPHAQAKLVRVVSGSVYDVAVNIASDSAQFGQWFGVELSAANKRQLLIPPGFAHGFMTLAPDSEVVYKVNRYYSREHDRGIRWDDPDLAIRWPLADPILSDKDRRHPLLAERSD